MGIKIHGKSKTPLYRVWKGINERCNNVNHKAYKNYGAKGATRCSEWNDFLTFERWALKNGWKKGLHVSRKEDKGNYSPTNCSIKTKSENTIERNINRKGFTMQKKYRFTKEQISEMKVMAKMGVSYTDIGVKFGVSDVMINMQIGKKRGFTKERNIKIKFLREEGLTYQEIADRLNTTTTTVYRVVKLKDK